MTITGGCLCGQVRYEISGPLTQASHCHCSKCRRQHGAAFATYASFDPGHFRWTAGEDKVKGFDAGWCFCSDCGSSLTDSDGRTVTSVALGTVDGDPDVAIECHIFVGSKAPWFEITENLPQFDERPPDGWVADGGSV